MRRAELEGENFEKIARNFLSNSTDSSAQKISFLQYLWDLGLWRLTKQHLFLVFGSLIPAILVGIPLGILATFSFLTTFHFKFCWCHSDHSLFSPLCFFDSFATKNRDNPCPDRSIFLRPISYCAQYLYRLKRHSKSTQRIRHCSRPSFAPSPRF